MPGSMPRSAKRQSSAETAGTILASRPLASGASDRLVGGEDEDAGVAVEGGADSAPLADGCQDLLDDLRVGLGPVLVLRVETHQRPGFGDEPLEPGRRERLGDEVEDVVRGLDRALVSGVNWEPARIPVPTTTSEPGALRSAQLEDGGGSNEWCTGSGPMHGMRRMHRRHEHDIDALGLEALTQAGQVSAEDRSCSSSVRPARPSSARDAVENCRSKLCASTESPLRKLEKISFSSPMGRCARGNLRLRGAQSTLSRTAPPPPCRRASRPGSLERLGGVDVAERRVRRARGPGRPRRRSASRAPSRAP